MTVSITIGYTVAMVGVGSISIIVLSICWAVQSSIWAMTDRTADSGDDQ